MAQEVVSSETVSMISQEEKGDLNNEKTSSYLPKTRIRLSRFENWRQQLLFPFFITRRKVHSAGSGVETDPWLRCRIRNKEQSVDSGKITRNKGSRSR